MPLSWNEIRHNAIRFSKEWSSATRESAEKQTFWNEFFAVFGLRRRTVASFEEPVKRITGDYGYIDLFEESVVKLRCSICERGGCNGEARRLSISTVICDGGATKPVRSSRRKLDNWNFSTGS